MNIDQARAMPSRCMNNCDIAAALANGGTAASIIAGSGATAGHQGHQCGTTLAKSPMMNCAHTATASS